MAELARQAQAVIDAKQEQAEHIFAEARLDAEGTREEGRD